MQSFLHAIKDMNDISSQENNQIIDYICDCDSGCVGPTYYYICQILDINPHKMKGDRFDI